MGSESVEKHHRNKQIQRQFQAGESVSCPGVLEWKQLTDCFTSKDTNESYSRNPPKHPPLREPKKTL